MQFCISVNRRIYQKRVKRELLRTNTKFEGTVLKELTMKMVGQARGTARATSLGMRSSFYRDRVLGLLMTLK
jgi:hypothetical protein